VARVDDRRRAREVRGGTPGRGGPYAALAERHDDHFRLCRELSKHLHELLGWPAPLTHRQFLAWRAWLRAELDRPDKITAYLQQIACEVRRGHVRHPGRVKLDDLKLTFEEKTAAPAAAMTREQAAALSKARWGAWLGVKPDRETGG
jgi:hypothetical protein